MSFNFIPLEDTPGLVNAMEGWNPFKIIGKLKRDEYTLHLILFENNELGLFIWNDFLGEFNEEPGDLEFCYDETEEGLIEKYPSLESPLEDWKDSVREDFLNKAK